MFRNYLLITLRNFRRQKLFSLLNIFGLALALASAMFIFLYVSDELRYDTMQPYYKDTYRIGTTYITGDGQHFYNTVAPGFFIRYLKDNRRDDILYTTRIIWIGYPTALNYKREDKIVLTEERTKEVGIRKVLGAGDKHVAALFTWVFVKIFIIASLLAIPLSWFFGYKWLQGFVYRVSINPLIFILSLLGLLLVTFLTVGYEIWKSVRAKPVVALRTE